MVSTNKQRCSFYNGADEIFRNAIYKFNYTFGVRSVAQETESFWLLDIINSYQKSLADENFQVWKLEREFERGEEGEILNKLDSFNVYCLDGRDEVIKSQKIEFSDFPDDLFTLWLIDGLLLLPEEY